MRDGDIGDGHNIGAAARLEKTTKGSAPMGKIANAGICAH
jgi:hypothetical protein